MNGPRLAVENGHRAGIVEAGFAGVTGIEKKRLADVFVVRVVRMAEDDDVRFLTGDAAFGNIREPMDINDVMDQELALGEFDDFGFPIAQTYIIISENGGHWGNP